MRKNDLYNLINSLTVSEKKQFVERNAANRSKDAVFMKVFDAIANKKAHNDETLKQHFDGEKFLAHLHKTKAYLYDSVMEMLTDFEREKFVALQLLQKLAFMEMLLGRKLFEEAGEIGKEILAACPRQSSKGLLIEYYCLVMLTTIEISSHQEVDVSKFEKLIKEIDELNSAGIGFYSLYNSFSERGKGNVNAHKKVEFADFFSERPDGISSQLHYLGAKSLFYNNGRDATGLQSCNEEIADITEEIANLSPAHEFGHINALWNFYLSSMKAGLDKDSQIHVQQRMESFQPQSALGKALKFTHLARIKTDGVFSITETNELMSTIEWLKTGLEENKSVLAELELVKIYFSIAQMFMLLKKYDTALDYLLPFFNSDVAKENRPVHYRVAYLYMMICRYELNELDMVDNMLRNHKYFLNTKNSFYKIEEVVHQLLKQLIVETDTKRIARMKLDAGKQTIEQDEVLGLSYIKEINWL